MAEIRVQERRRSLAWLWILLLALLIGAAVWWWMTTQDRGTAPAAIPTPADDTRVGPSPGGTTAPAAAPPTADTVSL